MASNHLFVQAQPFSLSGSGASSGATSVTLSSFKQIDASTTLTMTNFGSKGYMTLEPGSGTQEEQISFTGITQNSDGTATLTGVSTVLFISPYTETSGLAKSHAGGTTAVISNTAGFYNHFVDKDDTGTINQVLTFATAATPIITDAPTTQTQAANKGYVDGVALAGAPKATTTVQGNVQLPNQSQVDTKAALASGSTGASLAVTTDKLRATKYNDYVADTGTSNAYAIAPSPVITQYAAGLEFRFKAAHGNTGASTLAVNGLTAKSLVKNRDIPLASGDISTNYIVGVVYDGNLFQMVNTALPKISIDSREIYATSTTGNTAWAITLSPVPTAYAAGLVVNFKPDTVGGHPTLSVNSLAAKNVKKYTNGAIANIVSGDVVANQIVTAVYDGTQFQMTSAKSGAPITVKSGVTTYDMSTASGTQTIAHGLAATPSRIRLIGMAFGDGPIVSYGTYDGTNHANIATGTTYDSNSTSRTIYFRPSNNATEQSQSGVATFDATNITITWTKLNSPTGTAQILWEAQKDN